MLVLIIDHPQEKVTSEKRDPGWSRREVRRPIKAVLITLVQADRDKNSHNDDRSHFIQT